MGAVARAHSRSTTCSWSRRYGWNRDILSMVIPSRWMAGGTGLDEFRKTMLTDDGALARLSTTQNATDVSRASDFKGGVCYFLWDRDNTRLMRSTPDSREMESRPNDHDALLDAHDVFIRDNRALSHSGTRSGVEASATMDTADQRGYPVRLGHELSLDYVQGQEPSRGSVALYRTVGTACNGSYRSLWHQQNAHLID